MTATAPAPAPAAARSGSGRRPDTFIIGAPKSGTTSLFEYLAGHPDVYMSPIKEPFYFSPDVQGSIHRRFEYGADEDKYLALYADARGQKRLGEGSTRYLRSRVAPNNIHVFDPNARAIVMLRNPVDFVYAFHNERVSQGEEPVTDFTQAIALDDERRAGQNLPPGSNSLGAVYHDSAMFGEQLERWFDALGRDRVHVIIFEDFVRDTPGAFRKVLEFLDIDADYRPSEFAVVNPSHRLRGGYLRKTLNSRPAQTVAHRVLPAVIGDNATSRLARRFRHSRINRRPNPRPPLSAKLRHELEADFSADVERLSQLLGRDMKAEWFAAHE